MSCYNGRTGRSAQVVACFLASQIPRLVRFSQHRRPTTTHPTLWVSSRQRRSTPCTPWPNGKTKRPVHCQHIVVRMSMPSLMDTWSYTMSFYRTEHGAEEQHFETDIFPQFLPSDANQQWRQNCDASARGYNCVPMITASVGPYLQTQDDETLPQPEPVLEVSFAGNSGKFVHTNHLKMNAGATHVSATVGKMYRSELLAAVSVYASSGSSQSRTA
ncbi:hypothetical protein QBC34DRAFT_87308 [Podospora aff. communis PSN243]|uniref:Uncharacterized protein n=1 Tax=Podospora aff. communis PSN243 TaxID=3040156 RepID=A0AAV9GNY7_9PEZI|nr:hypothetical protein QBC34DRAFT_87308 [Podospora aff. communis PSN243]